MPDVAARQLAERAPSRHGLSAVQKGNPEPPLPYLQTAAVRQLLSNQPSFPCRSSSNLLRKRGLRTCQNRFRHSWVKSARRLRSQPRVSGSCAKKKKKRTAGYLWERHCPSFSGVPNGCACDVLGQNAVSGAIRRISTQQKVIPTAQMWVFPKPLQF